MSGCAYVDFGVELILRIGAGVGWVSTGGAGDWMIMGRAVERISLHTYFVFLNAWGGEVRVRACVVRRSEVLSVTLG